MSTRTKIKRQTARQLRRLAVAVEDIVPEVVATIVTALRRWADKLHPPRTITFPRAQIWMSPRTDGEFKLTAEGVPVGDDWTPVGGVRAASFSFHDTIAAFGGGEVSQ